MHIHREALDAVRVRLVAIVTAHSGVDYEDVIRRAKIVCDFRNATRGLDGQGKVWKL